MTTIEHHAPPLQKQLGETKMKVNVETSTQPTITKEEKTESKEDEGSTTTFKQILSSLAETKKYLPNQVNSFLDSMEGKTIDDLKSEAMHLANKAQEEAKKKGKDMENYGLSKVETARNAVQNVAEMASKTTSDIAHKGLEMVQTPLKATAEKAKELKDSSMETTTNLATKGIEMAQVRLKPVTQKAKEYLPQPAKDFVEQNVEGKTIDELRKNVVTSTRKNLLSLKDDKQPTVRELIGEVKGAVMTGELLKNTLSLSEKAVSTLFGEFPTSPDQGAMTRMFNISKKVTTGMTEVTSTKLSEARRNTMDMVNQRVDQARQTVKPYVTPILNPVANGLASLPLVSPLGRMLGGSPGSLSNMFGSGTASAVGTDNSMQKSDTTTTTTATTAAATPSTIAPHAKVSVELAVPAQGSLKTLESKEKSTSAQAGTGLSGIGYGLQSSLATPSGSEHQETSVPPTQSSSGADESDAQGKSKKKYQKL